MSDKNEFPHLIRAANVKDHEDTFCHPWNADSEVTGTHLSGVAGLKRTGVSIVRISPGKESFAYHLHHREEEWIYILSGRAVADIDGCEYEMGPGDFVGFPTPSVAHNLANPFDTELVYLMGGESLEHEIADFPRIDKRIVRMGKDLECYKLSDGTPFYPSDE